jgi:hypothetical protein
MRTRRNRDMILIVRPGRIRNADNELAPAYPYGAYLRLLMIWLATRAVQTKDRTIAVGSSQSEFMADLGIRKGDSQAKRLQDQLYRLAFANTVVDHQRASVNPD